jgi:hypothetical protein
MANETKNSIAAEAKRQSSPAAAFGRLSRREQTMIFALIAVGVVCALAFLLVTPGLERIKALEGEVAQAEEQRMEYVTAIAQGQGTEQTIAEAQARYDEAKDKLFPQMLPEALDTTVTKYLVKAGFDPLTLSMSQLTPEEIVSFSPQPLNGMSVPQASASPPAPDGAQAATPDGTAPVDSGQSSEDDAQAEDSAQADDRTAKDSDATEDVSGRDDGTAKDGGTASALPWDGSIFLTAYADDTVAGDPATSNVAAGDVAAGDPAVSNVAEGDVVEGDVVEGDPAADNAATGGDIPILTDVPLNETVYTGGSVYSYSVNVTAKGGWSNLYKLIDKISKVSGAEITQYSYSESIDAASAENGSFTMMIKFFIFVQDAPAAGAADEAQMQ